MAASMTLDAEEFNQAVLQIAREANVEMGVAIRWQMALWCADVIKKLGPNKFQLKPLGAQKKTTEFNIEVDAKEVFSVIPDTAYRWFNQRTSEWGFRKNNLGAKDRRDVFFVPQSKFLIYGGQDEMAKIHDAKRVEGRVPENKDFKSKISVMAERFRYYIDWKRDHVGQAKAAWVTSYTFFNKDGLAKFSIPSWITRHTSYTASKSSSSFTAATTGPINIQAQATSSLAWGDDPAGVVETVGRTRFLDLMRKGKGGALWRLGKIMEAHSARKAA